MGLGSRFGNAAGVIEPETDTLLVSGLTPGQNAVGLHSVVEVP
jgi:hypothetical protein